MNTDADDDLNKNIDTDTRTDTDKNLNTEAVIGGANSDLGVDTSAAANEKIHSPFPYYIKKFKGFFSLGILALIITDISDVLTPLILGKLLDKFVVFKNIHELVPLFILFAIASIANATARYAWRILFANFHHRTALDLKLKLFKSYFKKDLVSFNEQSTGDKMSTFNKDVEYFRMGIGPGVLILFDGIFYLTLIPIAMWNINSDWAKIIFFLIPTVPIIMAVMEKYLNKLFDKQQKYLSKISSIAQESIEGIKVIKSFRMERLREHVYDTENLKLYNNSKKLEIVHSSFSPLFDFCTSISCAALLLLIAHNDNLSTIQAGSIFAFYQYLRRMTWPLAAIGFSFMMITEGKSAFKRIRKALDSSEMDLCPLKNKEHVIEQKAVGFSYPDKTLSFNNLNLNINKNASYLVTGATKSGKSSLIKLLAGLLRPISGSLALDKKKTTYNAQDPFLFMSSLKENLLPPTAKSKKTDQTIDEKDFKAVAFYEELLKLENKADTIIGEKGANLSGGQKQRLSLLRALKSDKDTLILDEPISAVDESTKLQIIDTLKTTGQNKTLIISTSSPEHFRWMDNVILIKDMDESRSIDVLSMDKALRRSDFTNLLYKKKGVEDEV
jgi:ATP-binding cassette subfamily B protein